MKKIFLYFFYFDKGKDKYIFMEPEDMYTYVYEGSKKMKIFSFIFS